MIAYDQKVTKLPFGTVAFLYGTHLEPHLLCIYLAVGVIGPVLVPGSRKPATGAAMQLSGH